MNKHFVASTYKHTLQQKESCRHFGTMCYARQHSDCWCSHLQSVLHLPVSLLLYSSECHSVSLVHCQTVSLYFIQTGAQLSCNSTSSTPWYSACECRHLKSLHEALPPNTSAAPSLLQLLIWDSLLLHSRTNCHSYSFWLWKGWFVQYLK